MIVVGGKMLVDLVPVAGTGAAGAAGPDLRPHLGGGPVQRGHRRRPAGRGRGVPVAPVHRRLRARRAGAVGRSRRRRRPGAARRGADDAGGDAARPRRFGHLRLPLGGFRRPPDRRSRPHRRRRGVPGHVFAGFRARCECLRDRPVPRGRSRPRHRPGPQHPPGGHRGSGPVPGALPRVVAPRDGAEGLRCRSRLALRRPRPRRPPHLRRDRHGDQRRGRADRRWPRGVGVHAARERVRCGTGPGIEERHGPPGHVFCAAKHPPRGCRGDPIAREAGQ